MGRAPCCDKANVKKGPWSPEEDAKLKDFIDKYGTGGNWIALPQKAGLKRCGKSCRLRWLNYLRPNIKHGDFTDEEDRIICSLFANIGSRWSIIAAQLPGRTDNDIKNYWNTKLKKKIMAMAPASQRQTSPYPPAFSSSTLSLFLKDLEGHSFSSYPKALAGFDFDPLSQVSSTIFGSNAASVVFPTSSSTALGFEASCSSSSDGQWGRGYIPSVCYGMGHPWEPRNVGLGEGPMDLNVQDMKHLISSNSGFKEQMKMQESLTKSMCYDNSFDEKAYWMRN